MADTHILPDPEIPDNYSSRSRYKECLEQFDAAVCEACAVSQAVSGQFVFPSLGYATHVFVRILAQARNLLRSVPKNRWRSSDHDDWDFGANAGGFRSILEASLLFYYLCDADPDKDNQRAIVQLMHLYDLTKRLKIIHDGIADEEAEKARAEIIGRLEQTQRFKGLPEKVKKDALKGGKLMFETKEDIMARKGWDKSYFYLLWNITSQHAHVQSLAFYRIEPNGRGTGLENSYDRGFLALGLETCAETLVGITDALCQHFPDAAVVRKGTDSKFSPGPARNLPKETRRAQRRKRKPARR